MCDVSVRACVSVEYEPVWVRVCVPLLGLCVLACVGERESECACLLSVVY